MTARQRSARAALVGLGATATMDLGGEAVRRATGVAPLDDARVGRWIGHMRRGQFTHDSIHAAPPAPEEKRLGLVMHYGISIAFAGLLLACRPGWTDRPTLAPAMATGLGSTVASFVLMQPAFGMGIAASKTPNPTVARLRSIRAHAMYGLPLRPSTGASAQFRLGTITRGLGVLRKRNPSRALCLQTPGLRSDDATGRPARPAR